MKRQTRLSFGLRRYGLSERAIRVTEPLHSEAVEKGLADGFYGVRRQKESDVLPGLLATPLWLSAERRSHQSLVQPAFPRSSPPGGTKAASPVGLIKHRPPSAAALHKRLAHPFFQHARSMRGSLSVSVLMALLSVLTASLSAQSTHALIVASASGEEQFKQQFWDWGTRLERALSDQMHVPKSAVLFLFEDPTKGPSLVFGKSTKSELTRAVEKLGNDAKEGDLVLIVLLGHGSYDGTSYKFNLVGPDATSADLEQILSRFAHQKVVLVAATPCSGGLTRTLAGKDRVIISATKSELENNQTVFGGFFVEAFENQAADFDKNGRVSMLEAYQYARTKVEDYYKERQKLATEHPLLEDDGNGRASSIPSPETGDGLLASRLSPGPAETAVATAAPGDQKELMDLQAKKRKVEADIEALKYRRSTMADVEYQKNLETLLLELARTDGRIRELEKPK